MDVGERKDFDKEAAQWDAKPDRVRLANDVADAIIREMSPLGDVHALDFGCGTGLITLRLQPHVKKITGVDSSQGMLEVLRGKIRNQELRNVDTMRVDLEKGEHIKGTFGLIVSSMTLHHVPDTASLFRQWYALLESGGWICFADLDREDGSFHSDATGVFHHGFDRAGLRTLLQKAGYRDIRDTTASTMIKDVAGAGVGKREFSVFLISARK